MGYRQSSDAQFCAKVVTLCLAWYAVSSGLNIVNKIILQNYPVPMTLALSNLMFVPIYCSILISWWDIKPTNLSKTQYSRYLYPLSFAKAFAVATGYFTLWKVPVSYAATVKGSMPIFAVFLSRLLLKEKQSIKVYISLLPIVFGVIIASTTELSFSTSGLISALLSTFTYSLMNIMVKKLMKETDIHPIRFLSVNCQLAAIMFFPLWLFKDAFTFFGQIGGADGPSVDLRMILLLGCSGLLSFLQNVCAMSLIHQLTALSYAVCNATKRIVVITSSLLTLHNPVTAANVFGMMLSIVGVFCYNRAKQIERQEKSEVLPMTRSHTFSSEGALLELADDSQSSDMLYRATRGNSINGSRLGELNYSEAYNDRKMDDISRQYNNNRRVFRHA